MNVFLVWQNDGLLGVFLDIEMAREKAKAVREDGLNRWRYGHWEEVCQDRWCTPEGPIARLCIEEELVVRQDDTKQMQDIYDALNELVECKVIKERMEEIEMEVDPPFNSPEYCMLKEEWEVRKGPAWSRAKELIG